ncbi:MAG: hypothetical protein CL565_05245 [Alphaproteobacteria bacterium]|nr:hypothetical protein [Alphaproteobacteria bacterium]
MEKLQGKTLVEEKTDLDDNVFYGISFISLAGLFVTLMNACVKLASQNYDVLEIVFYRGLFILPLLFLYMTVTHKWSVLKTRAHKTHILRSVMGTISVCLVYLSYSLLPMADATALLMTSGLIITALSSPFLGEKVGPLRWAAVVLGFVGAILVIQPEGNSFKPLAGSIALCGAFTIASVNLLLRKLGRSEPPLATITYFMICSVTVSGVYVFFYKGINLDIATLHILVGVAFFALLQQIFKTYATALAEASVLSPYTYLNLLWAIILGVIIWDEWPSLSVWLGGFIIIAANGFVLWREQKLNKNL